MLQVPQWAPVGIWSSVAAVTLAPRQRGQSRSQRSSSMPRRVASRQASITCRSGTPQRRASGSGRIRSASTSSPSAITADQPLGEAVAVGAGVQLLRQRLEARAGRPRHRHRRRHERDRPLAAREPVGLLRQAQEHALGRAQEAAGQDERGPSSPLGAASRR